MKRYFLAFAFLAACTVRNDDAGNEVIGPKAGTDSSQISWSEFRSHFQELNGRLQGEWDLSFASDDELHAYYVHHYGAIPDRKRETSSAISSVEQKLAVIRRISDGFEPTYRGNDALDIVYCVSNTVPNQTAVIADMATATLDWLRTTNIRFRYDATQNGNCIASNNAVDIAVLPTTATGLAGCGMSKMIWFNDCALPGELRVQYSALSGFPGVTGAGLLRHELGHVLGFRHEHPWAPSQGGCSEAPSPADGGLNITGRRLTNYDQQSVMHYPQCSGIANVDMTISALDRRGAISVYGIPAALYVVL